MMFSNLVTLLLALPSVLGAPPSLDLRSIPSVGWPSITPTTWTATSIASPTLVSQSNFSPIITPPTLSANPFTPYPLPTLPPNPPVYPAADPLYPPDVSDDPQIVPDFGPAWAAAYKKAKKLVSNIWNFLRDRETLASYRVQHHPGFVYRHVEQSFHFESILTTLSTALGLYHRRES